MVICLQFILQHMKKILAIISGLITGGVGIALVSSLTQAAHASITPALTTN